MSELVSKESMMEDGLWLARDTLNSLRIIPRHIKWLLKEFAKKKYRLDIEISGIRTFNALANHVDGVIKLTIGELDVNTPEIVKIAAIKAISNNLIVSNSKLNKLVQQLHPQKTSGN